MGLITPEPGLIIWQLIFFLLLFFVLAKYAWKPILATLKEREGQIEGALRLAEQTRAEMTQLKANNDKLQAEARADRDQIIKAAKVASDKMINEAKDKAAAEGKRIIEDAREAINNERNAIVAQMKKEVVTLSLDIAEKILRKELSDKPSQEKLVTELVGQANLN